MKNAFTTIRDQIVKRYTVKDDNFENKKSTDINILLNAKNLATSGVSAFPIACALMSQKLEKLIFSNIYLDEHLNPEMINEKFVEKFEYKIKNYS